MNQGDTTQPCKSCIRHLNLLASGGFFNLDELGILMQPSKIIRVNYPLHLDSGNKKFITGYRVQYNNVLGPTKGGLRFHDSVSLAEVTELAFLMTMKNSLLGLPYGGAKGGVRINPKELSEAEIEGVSRGFIRSIHNDIGEDTDIPAPDVNTNPQVMMWMLNEFEKINDYKSPAAFTGKPVDSGGIAGRETSTSLGGSLVLKNYLKQRNLELKEVAIQGFGNVGYNLAKILYNDGFKIVAVSDSTSGVFNKDGLDIGELSRQKKQKGNFIDFEGHKKISNQKLLELDVDILVPAALGGVIDKKVSKKVQASLILEMANAPVTVDADKILEEKGIEIIPDILSNSGGVVVSYFEWLQNKKGEVWKQEKVENELGKILISTLAELFNFQSETKTDMRTTSYIKAIKRIVESA